MVTIGYSGMVTIVHGHHGYGYGIGACTMGYAHHTYAPCLPSMGSD